MKKRRLIAITSLLIIYAVTGFAQTPCSGDIDDPGYNENGCDLPLDTYVYVLLFAALCYAVWYLRKNKEAVS